MIRSRPFACITAADFTVRSAYQMGKTPLLPIFAAALGAGDAFVGFIVSVSTLTGMVLKPFVGALSDRWGRRGWLIIGTAFFAGMPLAIAASCLTAACRTGATVSVVAVSRPE